MSLAEKYPPLYQCESCNKAVKVKVVGEGVEPIIKRTCNCPDDTPVLARRKVTLRGKGELEGNFIKQQQVKITMTCLLYTSDAADDCSIV